MGGTPAQDPAHPRYAAAPQRPTPGPGSSPWWWVVVAILLVVVGGSALVGLRGDDEPTRTASPAQSATAMPEDEQQLIAIISDAQEKADGESEDIVVGIHQDRTTALCRVLPSDKGVSDWVGTVVDVKPDVDGKGGALSVRISAGIELWTTRNTFSASGAGTLIGKDEPLYETLTGLAVGDDVTFSGRFLPDEQNCVEDLNVTPQGSVEVPIFFFDFSEVTVR